MKFEVINSQGRCMQSTTYPECVPYDLLDSMSAHGYKFRVNGKIVAKNKVKSAVMGIAEVVDKVATTADTDNTASMAMEKTTVTKSSRSRGAIICVEDNLTFESQSEAAKHYGISAMSVSKAVKTGKPVKGHTFKGVQN